MQPIKLLESSLVRSGLLTSDATVPTAGDTVRLGKVTYTFVSTVVNATPNQVLIGVSAAVTLDNLKLAVNAGTNTGEYSSSTLQNADVDATTNTDTTQLFVRRSGSTLDRIPFEEASTHLSTNAVDGVFGVAYTMAPGTYNSDFDLPDGAKGFVCFVTLANEVGTATLDLKFQYLDETTGNVVDVTGASIPQKSAAASFVITVHPGATASANVVVAQPVSRRMRAVFVEAGGGSSFDVTATIYPV